MVALTVVQDSKSKKPQENHVDLEKLHLSLSEMVWNHNNKLDRTKSECVKWSFERSDKNTQIKT